MPLFKDKTHEILVKIVFYGPGLAGKSTILRYLHEQTPLDRRGELRIWGNEADTIIDFDLLPASLNTIKGYTVRFQLYTVPGQVKSNRSRKFILEGVDAIVFVADSQRSKQKANLISLGNLKENLRANQLSLNDIPMVYAYNKRDLKDILTPVEIKYDLNPTDRYPSVETVASTGKGVPKVFEIISNLVIRNLHSQLQHLEEEVENEFLGVDDFSELDDAFDFAMELEPVDSQETRQPAFSYAELLVETYHDGEIIFEEGDTGDRMYYIEGGQVKIVATSQRERKVIAEYRKGKFFGETALFGKDFRSARAVAVGTTTLLPITRERLASQIHNRPEIAEAFLESLSNRVRNENQKIQQLLAQNTELQERLKHTQEAFIPDAEQYNGSPTVDLTFSRGIDWQAFLLTFHQLNRRLKHTELSIQGIEKRRDEKFTIKIAVPEGLDQEKVYQAFQVQYKQQLAQQQRKHKNVWRGNEKVVARCRQQAIDMQNILRMLSQEQALNLTVTTTNAIRSIAQLQTKEDYLSLYSGLSYKMEELRRKYIQEKDTTMRGKLKSQIARMGATLNKIEQRLEGFQI